MKRFTITHCLLLVTWAAIAFVVASQYLRTNPYNGLIAENYGLVLEDDRSGRQFTIDEELIAAAPAWDTRKANPPLSARNALAIANRVLNEKLTDTKYQTWYLEQLALMPMDGKNGKWCWFVLFNLALKPNEYGGRSGPPIQYGAYILMDGTVVALESGEYFDSLEHMGLVRDPDETPHQD